MKKIAALVIAIIALGAGIVAWRAARRPYRGFQGERVIEIAPHTPTIAIARTLARNGVLRERWPFLLLAGLGRMRGDRLMAGEYRFEGPVSPLDVFRKIAHGLIYLHKVVIPEGSDRFDMARIYQRKLGIDPQAFLKATRDTALIRDLDPQAPTLEGYLFPDTYRFPRGVSAMTVVKTMVMRFREVLKERFGNEMSHSKIPLHEAVTIASLVEKEADAPAEQPQIAEVFERRLKLGMPLGSDPTVIYAERLQGRFILDSQIRKSDLEDPSPYNTYANPGLPPGPICSPGASSLEAVWHPASGDYLYFVSRVQGGHMFARTLAGHLRNVARYRRELERIERSATKGGGKPTPRRTNHGK